MLLGRIVSPIIMALVFFSVVTPTGLIMKLFKKDLLKLKRKDKKSYWIERKSKSEKGCTFQSIVQKRKVTDAALSRSGDGEGTTSEIELGSA